MNNVFKQLNEVRIELAQAKAYIAELEAQLEVQRTQNTQRPSPIRAGLGQIEADGDILSTTGPMRRTLELGWDIFIFADANGSMFSISDSVTHIMGYTPTEFLALSLETLIYPDDLHLFILKQKHVGEIPYASITFESRWKHKGGYWMWMEFTSTNMLHDPDLRAVVINVRDVTERKLSQEAERIATERYRAIVEDQTELVCRYTPDFTLTFVNRAYAEQYGNDADSLIGANVLAMIPEIDWDAATSHIQKLTFINPISETEHRSLMPDGSIRWFQWRDRAIFDETRQIIEYQGVGRDVTEHKQLQEKLQSSEVLYRTLVESFDNVITLSDTAGHYLFANEAAWTRFNIPPEKRAQATVYDFFSKENADFYMELLQQVVQTEMNLTFLRKIATGSQQIWWQTTFVPVEDANGRITRVLANAVDVTRLKEQEQILQRSAIRLAGLHAIDKAVIATRSLNELADDALVHIAGLVPCQRITVSTVDVTAGTVKVLSLYTADAMPPTELRKSQTYPVPSSIINAIKSQRYLLINSFMSEVGEALQQRHREGIEVMLSIGLKVEDKLIGVLNFSATDPGFFTDEYIENALEIADQLAIGINTITLKESLRKHTEDLEQRVIQRTVEMSQAKARVEAILDSSSHGIVLLNRERGIQQANRAFQEMFHCGEEQFFGKQLQVFIEPTAHMILEYAIQEVIANGHVQHLEVLAIRSDGSTFYIELGLARVSQFHVDGHMVVCNIQDITDRKARERELQYQAGILNHVQDAVISANADFRIQSWNKAAERIYGWRADEVIGQPFFEVLNSILEPMERLRILNLLLEQGYLQTEVIQSRCDGSEIYILSSTTVLKNENGEITGLVAVNHDITDRKAHERELQYQAHILEDVHDAVIATDLDFKITSWNRAAERIYGWRSEEVIGKTTQVIMGSELDPQRYKDIRQTLVDKGYLQLELVQHTKDGSTIHILSSATALKDENGVLSGTVAVNHDITDRKRAEDELRNYTNEVEDLYNHAPVGYHSLNYNGVYVQVNDTELEWFGYTRTEVIGKMNFQNLLTPASQEIFQKNFAFFKQNGSIKDVEFDVICRNGNVMTVLASARVIYDNQGNYLASRSTIYDITSLKMMQKAFQESEEKYRRLVDTMHGGLAILDADHHLTYVNDRACQLLGYERSELLDADSFDYRSPQMPTDTAVNTIDDNPGNFSGFELTTTRRDGHTIHLLVSSSPNYDSYGRFTGDVVVLTDFTAQKQAEQTLRKALTQEKELGELKSRFVSIASHEFRTPLATILALTETLAAYRDRMSEDQISARLLKIRKQIDHMNYIMEDILQIERIQGGLLKFNPSAGDLDALCRDIVEEFTSRPEFEKRVIYVCLTTPVQANFDQQLMRHIISNLISNALKYSPAPSPVKINLSLTREEIILQVSDNGIGIPADDIKHLFEPFHRASNVGTIPGTGLGLSIAKQAIELHGGTISIESVISQGAQFTVALPVTVPSDIITL